MTKPTFIGIAWYKPEQWDRLLEISIDRDELEATYAEWRIQAQKRILELEKEGIFLRRIIVDVEDLLKWCKEEGLLVDGAACASFVTARLQIEQMDIENDVSG